MQAIVSLARSFDVETIAGGVEDLETLALLRDFGVDYAQGYAINGLAPVASASCRCPRSTTTRRRPCPTARACCAAGCWTIARRERLRTASPASSRSPA